MISEEPAILAHRQKRSFVRVHYLIVVSAASFETGAIEHLAVWDGEDTQVMSVPDFGAMTFFGAGRILKVPDFEFTIGLDAQTYEVGLSQTDEVVQTLIRGYNTRLAPISIYRAEMDERGRMIAEPRRDFKGFIDGNPVTTPEFGGEGSVQVRIASDAKKLTHYGFHMKNHDFQKRRGNDQFRKYSTVEIAEVPWGREKTKNRDKSTNPRNF